MFNLSQAKVYVTGAAGFIGSNLVDRLLGLGCSVSGGDNFSTGKKSNLEAAYKNGLVLYECDYSRGIFTIPPVDVVFHLAANADIRRGAENPWKDLEQNTIATFHILEQMRRVGIRNMLFASSAAIYGEPGMYPTPEDAPMPVQTSLYGASKMACESLIQAYCETYGMRAVIIRLVSAMGPRYAHGHVIDFVHKLKQNPAELEVLGDGKQMKSYVHVDDVVRGMTHAVEHCWDEKINIFNIGTEEVYEVRESAQCVADRMKLTPKFTFTGGERGWIGDSPFVRLSVARLKIRTGWKPHYTIRQAIDSTVDYLTALA